jgi:hypothetical protein
MGEESNLDALVALLRNRAARIDERDDAAIDLGQSDDPAALTALLEVGSNPGEDETVVGSCGESIADIAIRRGSLDESWLGRLAPAALRELRSRLQGERPDLLRDT